MTRARENASVKFATAVLTADTTLVAGKSYAVNTTSGALTMTLPASADAGLSKCWKIYFTICNYCC